MKLTVIWCFSNLNKNALQFPENTLVVPTLLFYQFSTTLAAWKNNNASKKPRTCIFIIQLVIFIIRACNQLYDWWHHMWGSCGGRKKCHFCLWDEFLALAWKKTCLFYTLAQDASWLSICNIDLTPKPIQVPLKPIKVPLVFIVFVEVPRSGAAMLLRIF